jgi:hypothetical protein
MDRSPEVGGGNPREYRGEVVRVPAWRAGMEEGRYLSEDQATNPQRRPEQQEPTLLDAFLVHLVDSFR